MDDLRNLRRENWSLRDRFARLIGTVLRINSSLDLDTVLQEVVDSACALTGAHQGVITTIDAGGRLVDFRTSGVSAEEVRALVAWPDGPRLFEHLRDIGQPFQLADLPGYLEAHGFPPGPWPTHTMQGAPMRHRGRHVGHFFVGDKADGAPSALSPTKKWPTCRPRWRIGAPCIVCVGHGPGGKPCASR